MMRRSLRQSSGATFLLGTLALVAWGDVGAASLEEFDRRILEDLRSQNPSAVPLFEQANAARAAGKHKEAAELYGQVHVMAPRFDHALRRRCTEELVLGDHSQAVADCRSARGLEDSVENQSALALALTQSAAGSKPTDAELTEAINLAWKASNARPDDPFVQRAFCQTAMATNDLPALRAGVQRLQALEPDEMSTHYVL
jgi:tetratricopeptide (TPR) repeat protein